MQAMTGELQLYTCIKVSDTPFCMYMYIYLQAQIENYRDYMDVLHVYYPKTVALLETLLVWFRVA